ncbi:unnamed protein product [Hapterophycus canaliculatus]
MAEGGGSGSEGRIVCQRARHTVCGWQRPQWTMDGERRAHGDVNHDDGSSVGGSAAGRLNREGSALRLARTTCKIDDGFGARGGDDKGDDSSIHSLLTAVQTEINERRRGGGKLDQQDSRGAPTPKPFRERWASSADQSSLPTPTSLGLALPATGAFSLPRASEPTAPSAFASRSQRDSTSLKLVFTSGNASWLPSPPQQHLVGVDVAGTPARSRISSPPAPFNSNGHGDAVFDGKNFGDSLLGSGGNSGDFGPTSTSSEHGSMTASDHVSSGVVAGCCDDKQDCRRSGGGGEENIGRVFAGGGRGGLISPVPALPLTPSPLSLDRPRECLLWLW